MIKKRQLLCFCEVAQTKNITRAAENLYLSQPSVSYNIKELERELDVPLLDRPPGGGLTLTSYGEELLSHAQTILSDVNECEERLVSLKDKMGGQVTVFCSNGLLYHLLPEIIRFGAAPDDSGAPFQLQVRTLRSAEKTREQLLENPDAIAITAHMFDLDGFEHRVIGEEELFALLPADHPLARENHVRLAMISDLPLATPEHSNHDMLSAIEQMLKYEHFRPVRSEYSDLRFEERLMHVILNQCYTITGNLPVNRRDISPVRIDNPFNKRKIFMIWNRSHELTENEARILRRFQSASLPASRD